MEHADQIHNRKELKEIRRDLRNNATTEEEVLWKFLKNKKLGYKIRRQHSVFNYVLDFYCASKRLAIELDGAHHYTDEGKEDDKERDGVLRTMNLKILRFPNSMIRDNLDEVLEKIKMELDNS